MPARLTQEEFIKKIESVHGCDRFDYAFLEYKNYYTSIILKCKVCNKKFSITPSALLKGSSCHHCKGIVRLNTETFIEKSKSIFGDNVFDYSMVEYKGIVKKVRLKCLLCGKIFDIMARQHLEQDCGCPVCSKRGRPSMSTEDFLNRLHKKRGYLGYDFRKFEYKGNQIKSTVTCFKHSDFEITPNDLLFGYGCRQCGYEKITGRKPRSVKSIIDDIFKVHGNNIELDISTYINTTNKSKFKCNICGNIFTTRVASVLKGTGCPACKESKGERIIRLFLEENDIKFISQKRINSRLSIDFFIPETKTAIEYNGQQHYTPVKYFGGIKKLLSQAKRDIIKKHYCLRNDIRFIEIPYWKIDLIENILTESLCLE